MVNNSSHLLQNNLYMIAGEDAVIHWNASFCTKMERCCEEWQVLDWSIHLTKHCLRPPVVVVLRCRLHGALLFFFELTWSIVRECQDWTLFEYLLHCVDIISNVTCFLFVIIVRMVYKLYRWFSIFIWYENSFVIIVQARQYEN